MTTTPAPWGVQRMAPYAPTLAVPQYTPVIDPETQIAVIVDEHGRTVEMGAHGTSTNQTGPTTTGGGDGQNGGQNVPSDVDTMQSNDQDQGTG
ncbi:putative ATP-grasp-modified RiPP [Kitasatospora sp. NPDC086801]|uniref:putative ATP-grasp-modified RiPP n=1 Tax=Kitasatospora TaxID=2063 RepID=UPI002256AEDA|nr:putative ATP-grasp-modified RiPP [Kitasatospora purpeofusca]MCX4756128.1 putative ATP-grasp-modified RiPP [Kitasatospora purpeofusca]WSR36037.1 putative ATP-grasp-modified RiPP [Kitasatospora purpeofusca]WSR44327.1 putative ATP-grasp-modified RiPP [Kitasatospora purpeofusca]